MSEATMSEIPTTTGGGLPTEQQVRAATILQRSVCLTLHCRYLGNNRVVREDLDLADATTGEDMEADSERVRVTKQLLDRKHLRPVHHLYGAAKAYLRGVRVAGHEVFGPGTYLIPIALVVDVDRRLNEFRTDIETAVGRLVEEYPVAVAEGLQKLGRLGKASDYLSPAAVGGQFGFRHSYVSFAAPDRLAEVDMVLAERTRAEYETRLADAFDDVVANMRGDALRVLRELADRLAPGRDGKPKALRGTALDDLQAYVALLPKRNISGDDALVDAVARVAAYANGLDVETLRNAPAVREQMRALADEVAAELAGLVEVSAGRAISFGGLWRRG